MPRAREEKGTPVERNANKLIEGARLTIYLKILFVLLFFCFASLHTLRCVNCDCSSHTHTHVLATGTELRDKHKIEARLPVSVLFKCPGCGLSETRTRTVLRKADAGRFTTIAQCIHCPMRWEV